MAAVKSDRDLIHTEVWRVRRIMKIAGLEWEDAMQEGWLALAQRPQLPTHWRRRTIRFHLANWLRKHTHHNLKCRPQLLPITDVVATHSDSHSDPLLWKTAAKHCTPREMELLTSRYVKDITTDHVGRVVSKLRKVLVPCA